MNTIKEIIKAIDTTKRAAIICHYNPDGDTLGGSFALYKALLQKDIKADILCESILPDNYSFFNDVRIINDFERNKYDTIIFIDCASLQMARSIIDEIDLSKYTTINIDHHGTNEKYADINYVDSKSSSSAELVLDILKAMNTFICKEIAEYIYTAIITDTGQFAYSYTSSKTHTNAAYLIECGADFSKLHKNIFGTIPLKKALLQKRMLKNMEIFEDGKLIISRLDDEDFTFSKAKAEDTEALISILLSIKDSKVAVLIRQVGKNKSKASFRSTNDVDISIIAKAFGGGGHKQAAGASFELDTRKTQEEIHKSIMNHGIIK